MSQRVPFVTDSPTAIHPIGTAITLKNWGWFFKVYYFKSAVFCATRSPLVGCGSSPSVKQYWLQWWNVATQDHQLFFEKSKHMIYGYTLRTHYMIFYNIVVKDRRSTSISINVCVVTRLQVRRLKNYSLIAVRGKTIFSSPKSPHSECEIKNILLIEQRRFFQGVRRSVCEANHLSPSSAKVRN